MVRGRARGGWRAAAESLWAGARSFRVLAASLNGCRSLGRGERKDAWRKPENGRREETLVL